MTTASSAPGGVRRWTLHELMTTTFDNIQSLRFVKAYDYDAVAAKLAEAERELFLMRRVAEGNEAEIARLTRELEEAVVIAALEKKP